MIGLDIGTRFVKAVLFESDGGQIKVQSFACEQIIGNAFADREIKDFDAVGNALKKVKMAMKTKNKNVAVAISGSTVLTKIVYMDPDQQDFELEGQIEIEADSLIPYPLEEVYIDFEQIGESKTHTGKVDVLLSAAHKDMVDSRVTLLREIQFEPKVMDIEGYALGNALCSFAKQQNDEPIICLNIGASLLQLCVVKDNQVIYSKEHSFGMDSLIQDLSIIHTLEKQETERQLLNGELPATWRQDTFPIFLANLNQHISRAMQMYISSTHSERPQAIMICGGGANIEEIATDLEHELAVSVSVFNPFAEMQISEKALQQGVDKVAPQLAIAAGLAARSFAPCHI
ncbi:type IV pilus assembly protein PilM [Aliiglaciecola sp. LCG003]|uniref:type IV pilus assembly protein PilM n=1 Tax=Aliiglaciecola sp. LCG003 TaxID=3053655 RepID=UPI0025737929|nr:type IV pilus assembly protein PilM [Aliiglaciecola sp. LCG003]WJG11246.1 type IV pilus assembly protein PilM [Aliiglaciecola sp. LCG003]